MKRAIIIAGADTLVMSLWKVPDMTTKELMINFYELIYKGIGKAEALREAKLNIMKYNPHPYLWSGFISVGNPN